MSYRRDAYYVCLMLFVLISDSVRHASHFDWSWIVATFDTCAPLLVMFVLVAKLMPTTALQSVRFGFYIVAGSIGHALATGYVNWQDAVSRLCFAFLVGVVVGVFLETTQKFLDSKRHEF